MKFSGRYKEESDCNRASSATAKGFEDRALALLKQMSFRLTQPRVQVIRALAESNCALTAQDLHRRILASGGKIDAVSVYRILETLQSVGLAHYVGDVEGFLACHVTGDQAHDTHHLVCQQCGCIVELSVPDSSRRRMVERAAQAGFDTVEVKIEAIGTCAHCREKQSSSHARR